MKVSRDNVVSLADYRGRFDVPANKAPPAQVRSLPDLPSPVLGTAVTLGLIGMVALVVILLSMPPN